MTIRALSLGIGRARASRRVADYLALTKPRVLLMVLVTTVVGVHLGAPGTPDPWRLLEVLIGTGLAAAGSLALNQFLERDVDARMERTRLRPLPDGRLQMREALLFGGLLTVAGVGYLLLRVNGASAAVTAITALSYLGAYTPLKRRTSLCTVLGAIPGALPPLTGWVAVRPDAWAGGWILFGIVFLWQVPHTLAIASVYRRDYARAEIKLLPVIEPDGESTGRQVVVNCVALLAVGLLPAVMGMTGPLYFAGALALGAALTLFGLRLARAYSLASARRLVLASLLYLPSLFALMAYDKRPF